MNFDSARSAPQTYADLVDRHGSPLGVEEARNRWGRLVRDAERDGRVTLITRERWEWAALVPVAEVSEPLTGLPALPLSQARGKLGDLVRQVTRPHASGELLTRHRRPVAALVAAVQLAHPIASERGPAAETLLYDGHTIVLAFDPGHTGQPAEPVFTATARDGDGAETAFGAGGSIGEALLSLSPSRRSVPGEGPL
ncbi:hypothetical protein ABT294_19055 [Nonomuraea sp. NPDC000554]|uniref:hypothetical protein n=1 Tax=Nonomuraea sp. NPDC000554 TaxID=3154259 RepID=UPI00331D95D4